MTNEINVKNKRNPVKKKCPNAPEPDSEEGEHTDWSRPP